MKDLRYILILLFLITFSQSIFATDQTPDYLVYKGDTLAIYQIPLESYFDNHVRPESVFEEQGYHSTACGRGYIAYWELKNDRLYLTSVRGAKGEIKLSLIFPSVKDNEKVFASWYNDLILNRYGKLLSHERMGFYAIYEYEREFIFKNGILTKINRYDNTKTKKSKYSTEPGLLKKYIRETIDYSKISKDPYKKATVYVEILDVSKTGKIDSVRIIRGCDKERDLEAMRVVKSIPEWNVYYKRGKLYTMRWCLPVIFGKE